MKHSVDIDVHCSLLRLYLLNFTLSSFDAVALYFCFIIILSL